MSEELKRTVEIINERGLHARASAKFVKTASQFDAQITVSREGTTVEAQSIMGLMMLAAGNGSTVELAAQGPEALEALDALTTLIADRFEEER
jgi:phosphocarrier protein HPr